MYVVFSICMLSFVFLHRIFFYLNKGGGVVAHVQIYLLPILCRELTGCRHGEDMQEAVYVTLQNKIHSVVSC